MAAGALTAGAGRLVFDTRMQGFHVAGRWRALRANELYGMQRFWHEKAKVPWLYDAARGIRGWRACAEGTATGRKPRR